METEIITLTSQIVSAFVSKNSVQASDLPALITSVYQSLKSVGQPQASAEVPTELKPAVPVKKSVTPDYIVSGYHHRRRSGSIRWCRPLQHYLVSYRRHIKL